jgi:hypothetical protein
LAECKSIPETFQAKGILQTQADLLLQTVHFVSNAMLQRLAFLAYPCHQQQQFQVLLPLLVQQQQHLHQQQLQQQESLLAAPTQPFRNICTSCSSSSSNSNSSSSRTTSIRSSSSSTTSSPLSRHSTFACSSWSWVPNRLWGTQLASYSQRLTKLNPKERKAQQVKDKKALKKSAVPQGTASAADSTTSFEDETQTVEADVTWLVLQVGARGWPDYV